MEKQKGFTAWVILCLGRGHSVPHIHPQASGIYSSCNRCVREMGHAELYIKKAPFYKLFPLKCLSSSSLLPFKVPPTVFLIDTRVNLTNVDYCLLTRPI